MKILIVHDYFKFRGGAEKTMLVLARALKADILTAFWSDENSYPRAYAPAKIFTLINKEPTITGWRYFKYQYLFYFKTKLIKNYDLIIFSGNNCLSSSHYAAGRKKIFYCHTPVRYAYDLKNYYLKQKIWWKKPLLLVFIVLAKIVYRYGFNQMDLVIANSKNVSARISKYLGRETPVLFPPIAIDRFRWICQEDYYLSYGRVDELKRIELIISAFISLPDKKLVVASGGPCLDKIKTLAAGHKNITILGWVSDEKLHDLVGRCLATVYIPIDEDAGMTPLESMAAGKPCIGTDEGGLKETIIHDETGYLIPASCHLPDLIAAIEKITPSAALEMKTACIRQAQKFSEQNFVTHFRQLAGPIDS